MMVFFAVIIDGLQALADLVVIGFLIDPFLDFIAAVVLGMWLSHYGHSVMSSKRAGGFLLTTVGELIPGVDALPLWTVFVSYTIIKSRFASGGGAEPQSRWLGL